MLAILAEMHSRLQRYNVIITFMNKQILHVALPVPLRTHFDYLAPKNTGDLLPSMRVKVPFGKREMIGVVLSMSDKTACPAAQLKPVIEVIDTEPVLSPLVLTLCQKASDYYHHPIGEVVVGTLPKWVRAGREIPNSALCCGKTIPNVERCVALTLTPEQNTAVTKINATDGFKPFLLMGITGSGKTEVYLRCIEKVLAENKQALVLVPEIGLTPQTVTRFEQRFNVPVVKLHSNLTDKERFTAWCAAKSGEAKIVIGTRSAIFAPFKNLGMIVVDEEHDNSFKQQSGFRYSARDLAVWRAQMENIPVILGSATPSLETFNNALSGRYELLALKQRVNQAPLPKLKLIDLKNKSLQAGLSNECLQLMKKHLDQGQQVLVFLNRRGFAPTLMCHACGYVLHCKRCDARLTLHQNPRVLYCHHCGHMSAPPRICTECHKAELISIGQGTERLEETLTELFPGKNIVRIDRDTTRKKNSLKEKLDQIHSGEAQILIGTQMLAKGHHFPNLSLAVIVDVDGGLLSADFRATERMAQLITQVAGRAGREDIPGEVVLQTHVPEHPLLNCLLEKGYAEFAKATLSERQNAMLPPFSHLALIKAEAVKQIMPHDFLNQVKELLKQNNKNVSCLGPVPATMEKKAGKFRSHLLLQANNRAALQALLTQYAKQIKNLPHAKRVRWALDVDPVEV